MAKARKYIRFVVLCNCNHEYLRIFTIDSVSDSSCRKSTISGYLGNSCACAASGSTFDMKAPRLLWIAILDPVFPIEWGFTSTPSTTPSSSISLGISSKSRSLKSSLSSWD
ncbi:hypothetical protein GOBAR_AA20815 [Gossypium barbadense]|uniref:Uncharacterized protein n=1 Tax=Gossypium barbadense TaxID=3634 RepID=A0A2P5X942_GOSBA|nr:hypothetical protein GOBAR_AA20815 [Gossypium barbadense]